MKPSIRSLVPFFVALVALQGASALWMTATHNAQLKAQAEVFNAQLKAAAELHNAQLLAYEIGVRLVGSEMCIRDSF